MGKQSCFHEQKLRKGLWSPEEDEKLLKHIARHGHTCWSSVPKLAGLQRCGKSCRLRWINYLRPDLKRGTFSQQEESLIVKLHAVLGNRWSQIAAQLPGRTDNEIKNQWNSCIKKKLRHKGIDPNTHKPLSETNGGSKEDSITKSSSDVATTGLSATSNHLLWLNSRNREFGLYPELSGSSSSSSLISILLNSTELKPTADFLPESCANLSYWEPSNTAERGSHCHLPGEFERICWSEYLEGNLPVSSLLHFQIQPLQGGGEIKGGSNFDMESLGLCFQNHQLEVQKLQSAKELQRISGLMGQI